MLPSRPKVWPCHGTASRRPLLTSQLNFATTYPDNKTTHYATVDTRMTTIAQKLKNKGYSTHQIG